MAFEPGIVSTACFTAGCASYAVSFFLPAVKAPSSFEPVPGWLCAGLALGSTFDPAKFNPWLVGSGLLNFAVVFYIAARLSGSAPGIRRYTVFLVLLCIAFTCYFFTRERMKPLIGFYAWSSAAVFITFWEALLFRR